MELREYLRTLRRRAWIPLLLTIVTVSATAVFVFLARPQYTATATVIAKNPTGSTSNSLSFPQVVSSNSMALQVKKDLALSRDAASVAQHVKVSASQGNLYAVSFSDPNPDLAAKIANRYATDAASAYQKFGGGSDRTVLQSSEGDRQTFRDNYQQAAQAMVKFLNQHPQFANLGQDQLPPNADPALAGPYLLLKLDQTSAQQAYNDYYSSVIQARINEVNSVQQFEATVVDQAIAKAGATSGRVLQLVYAGILGLVLGIGLIFAVEYFDNSVREPEEAEELVGVPVIGMIPKASRAMRTAGAAA